MNFKQYLGKYVCGYLSETEYPEFAVVGLLEGFNSKYLGILAGMNKHDQVSELRKYFKWSLEDLKIKLPNKRQASILYSLGILEKIFNGEIELIEGVSEIKNDALSSYDFYNESIKYCYDSIYFHNVYELFVQYYDELDVLKPNHNRLDEIKVELLGELKKWNDKIKNVAQQCIILINS